MTHPRDQLVRLIDEAIWVPDDRTVEAEIHGIPKAADAILAGGWVRVDPEDPDTVERLARSLARAEATRETGQYWTDAAFNRYWSVFLGTPERERYIDHATAALRAFRDGEHCG